MLDKRTAQLLLKLVKLCQDGSYKIVDKSELSADKTAKSITEADRIVSYLRDNELIDVKYTDENVYCLTVLPKGRIAIENLRHSRGGESGLSGKTMCIMIIVCTLSAFFGALFGVVVASLW
jgi:hypothetical protein